MLDDPTFVPTTEEWDGGPTSNVRIEGVLHGLRTRRAGHLNAAVTLIEALRAERERRRTALNVLAVVVSLLLDQDQATLKGMDAMRHAMLSNALERAVLALYPETVQEAVHAQKQEAIDAQEAAPEIK